MSSYVRIKRQKQTIFLHVELTDLAVTLKEKISQINTQGRLQNRREVLAVALLFFE